MRYFLTTKGGFRLSVQEFGAVSLACFANLNAVALEILCRARMSPDVTDFPEVMALADAILAAPRDAERLASASAASVWWQLFLALALAYAARHAGAAVSVEPQDAGERASIALVHEAFPVLQ